MQQDVTNTEGVVVISPNTDVIAEAMYHFNNFASKGLKSLWIIGQHKIRRYLTQIWMQGNTGKIQGKCWGHAC